MKNILVAGCVAAFLFILPMLASAAGLVPCGGNGEPACQSCHVVTLVNNVVSWLVMILGTIAAILIVAAGTRLVTSGGNSSAKEEAKSMMTNLIIGYVIVLSGWLVIDYGLKAMLKQNQGAFGVWNRISCVTQPIPVNKDVVQQEVVVLPTQQVLTNVPGWGVSSGPGASTAQCERLASPSGGSLYDCSVQISQCTAAGGTPATSPDGGIVTCNPPAGGPSAGTGGSLPQCTNSACSVQALMAAGMTSTEANVMSCIAMTESSGNPSTPPYNQTHPGSNSSACGTFQIVRTTWNSFNPGGSCSDHASSCQNAQCNMAVATRLVKANGFRDWTCANCNSKAISCISRYGG